MKRGELSNMSKPIILLVFSLTTLGAAPVEESAEVLASRFNGLPVQEQTMANLPKGKEQEVLTALVKRQSVYPEVLLRLNHEPTVKRFFEKYLAVKGRDAQAQSIIASCGSPYIIAELAPLLYSTDQIFPRAWGEHADTDWGSAAGPAVLIGKIIQKAPEFSPALKEWAKETLNASINESPRPDIIHITRAWWELNRDALLANQFDQVKVPASYPKSNTVPIPPRGPSHSDIAPTPAPAASSPVAPASHPTPTAPTAPPAAPVTAPAATPANSSWWFLAAIAALAVAFLAARKKKPKH